jgi:DNA helicase-2/ATP-dependent DNA helicase PcrA
MGTVSAGLIDGLNSSQREGVATLVGPVLIVAGPGSGKTKVLTHRVAALLESGVDPWRIVAVTFTNKAAGEMRERLYSLVGEQKAKGLVVATFHSFCVRLLRRYHEAAAMGPDFTIADSDDSRKILRAVLKRREMLPDDAKRYHEAISWAKNNSQGPDTIESSLFHVSDVFADYQAELARQNMVDFDDLLTRTLALLRNDSQVREECQLRYQYLMVDEYQDTNLVQYEIVKIIAEEHHNLCVVGDHDQCLLPTTNISTPSGTKRIDRLIRGDNVLATFGASSLRLATVSAVKEGYYAGPVVTVVSGDAILTGTPHHMVPARLAGAAGDFYVCLMWRAGTGYRVGITKSVRSRTSAGSPPGPWVQMVQEHGDALWILRVCESLEEAAFYESYLAAKYGLVTDWFYAEGGGLATGGDSPVRLYQELNTNEPAERLMDDLLLHADYPHYTPQVRGGCHQVLLSMFGDQRLARAYHKISWVGADPEKVWRAEAAGYSVRGVSNTDRMRVETSHMGYTEALDFAESLARTVGAPLRQLVWVNGESYPLMPISNIHRGMRVLVNHNGELIEDCVDSVTTDNYTGPVFDIEVAGGHNFVAGGLLAHNSIYAWRGAFREAVNKFLGDFPEAKVVTLDQNYRSTKSVVALGRKIIEENESAQRGELWTDNDLGESVRVVGVEDDRDEAAWVVGDLSRNTGTSAIIVRTKAQTKAFEVSLSSRGIAHVVVGTQRFYDRTEIKDTLSWLRLALNGHDVGALTRAVSAPKRGLGDTTLARWLEISREMDKAPISVSGEDLAGLNARQRATIAKFCEAVAVVREAAFKGPAAAVAAVFATGLRSSLSGEPDRVENLSQLAGDAAVFLAPASDDEPDVVEEGLDATRAFVESASLSSNSDQNSSAAVSVITAHASKGREFDNVYVAGVEANLYPHRLVVEEEHGVEEERRLLFVAVTRARSKLTLLWCRRRMVFGKWEDANPSPFIEALGEDVVQISGSSSFERGRFQRRDVYTTPRSWAGAPVSSPTPVGPHPVLATLRTDQLIKGVRVSHLRFGEGTVVLDANEREVVVRFVDKSRTLLVAMAPLTLIG